MLRGLPTKRSEQLDQLGHVLQGVLEGRRRRPTRVLPQPVCRRDTAPGAACCPTASARRADAAVVQVRIVQVIQGGTEVNVNGGAVR